MQEAILKDINEKPDLRLLGGKGFEISKLAVIGLNIPKGFIITSGVFDKWIRSYFGKIGQRRMPKAVEDQIRAKINQIEGRLIVRSSANIEDSKNNSFAGQFKTMINIRGANSVMNSVNQIYNSVFDEKVLEYCKRAKIDHRKIKMSVIVQDFIEGDVSGVVFTVDPVTGEDNLVIEAVIGLNEGLVSGEITPSRFVIDKSNGRILSKHIVDQPKKLALRKSNGTRKVRNKRSILQFLNSKRLKDLSGIAKKIERVEGTPQDIEWTLKEDKIYVLQARQITSHIKANIRNKQEYSERLALSGYPASYGIFKGKAFVINNPNHKIKKKGAYVFRRTDTSYMNLIEHASAIVTEEGGVLSHAAIVARELKIPCVVGVNNATKYIHNGDKIVVDGARGKIFLTENKKPDIRALYINTFDEAALYCFDKMKRVRKSNIEVFYEDLTDRIVYYSKREIGVDKLSLIFPGRIRKGRNLFFGDRIKYLIRSGFSRYLSDPQMRSLHYETIARVDSFNLRKLEHSFLKIHKFALDNALRAQNSKYQSEYERELYRLLCYIRIRRAFLLLDTFVCEGYGLRRLYKNTKKNLDKIGITFTEFLSKATLGLRAFYTLDLNKNEKTQLEIGIGYYKSITSWKQKGYSLFVNEGLQGEDFERRYDSLIKKLNSIAGKNYDAKIWEQKAISTFAIPKRSH